MLDFCPAIAVCTENLKIKVLTGPSKLYFSFTGKSLYNLFKDEFAMLKVKRERMRVTTDV